MQTALIGALNGVIGDYLQTTGNPLAVDLNFYYREKPVISLLKDHTEHFPEWKDVVCVFIHGAAGSEKAWDSNSDGWSYGKSLYDEFKILPVHVRYNSGLHISENGKSLTRLFEKELHHPSIKQVFIVGHSMGGLVFRSACHYGFQEHDAWMDKITQVYYLGSPHLGAPLEKFGAWTQSILEKVESPYTQLAAKLINIRSNGIKDLRHGYLRHEEWQADEQDTYPVNNKMVIDHLEHARHFLVAGTAHNDPQSMISKWFGDIMVRQSSAMADCKQNKFNLPVEDNDILITGGHHHIKLMQSEEVYAFIRAKVCAQML